MHSIQTPAIPVTVETAVSGVSTPSSVGQVFPAEEERETAKFVVRWKNAEGQRRWCGLASGGISGEQVVRLLRNLGDRGITFFDVERVG